MLEILFLVGVAAIYATLLTALADATDFIYMPGGSWRTESPVSPLPDRTDPTNSRSVEGFLICTHAVTRSEYEATMHVSSGIASDGDTPAQGISWHDAIAYCNARSEVEGLTPAYAVDAQRVIWDRSADGYRLPTKTEWMYACQSGELPILSSGLTDGYGGLCEWVWEPGEETGSGADGNSREALGGMLRIICMEPPHAAGPTCFRLARSPETLMGTVSL